MKCPNHSTKSSIPRALLTSIGTLLLVGMGFVMGGITPAQLPVSPTTTPAKSLSYATPSPILSPSPTPDPFAPTSTPVILLMMEVTRTPIPTATLTPPEATLQAGQATATARAAPITCERTTVTPGESKMCFWEVVLPSPTPLPTYPPCETPVPAMRCEKEG